MKLRKINLMAKSIFLAVCILIIAIALIFASMSMVASASENVSNLYLGRLSELSTVESQAFLSDYDVTIPDELANVEDIEVFIADIITAVEENPQCEFAFSYNVTLDFANSIKDAVNLYYGVSLDTSIQTMGLSYTLQDSTLYSNTGWLEYNCYAYAIDRCENPPSYSTYRQYQIGDFSGESFSLSSDIYDIAVVVKSDLEELGYDCVIISSTMPTVLEGDNLICVRKGSTDYHFMKYSSGTWYHKPGFTAILQYNYQPTNDRVWIGEYVDSSGNAGLSVTTYDSDIYYILYSDDHVHSNSWISYSSTSHICYCSHSGCNEYILEPHIFDTMVGNRLACSTCGYIQYGTVIEQWSLNILY